MAVIDASFTETESYIIGQRIVSLILELIMIAIFTLYAYDCFKFLRKMIKKKKEKRVSSRDLLTKSTIKFRELCHVFSLLTLLTYCIQGGNYTLNAWSLYSVNTSCDVIEILSVLTYHLGKCWLYIVLILRIKIAFHGSAFMSDNRFKYLLYSIYFLTFTFFIVTLVGDNVEITGTLAYSQENNKMYFCLLDDMPTWGFLTFLGLDLSISILCVFVFIYPLRSMLKNQILRDNDGKIVELIRKYSILSTTAICSTFFLLISVSVFKLGWLSLLDNLINSICLLFMSSWYQKYWNYIYSKVCCCCNKAANKDGQKKGKHCKDGTVTMLSSTNPVAGTPRPTMTSKSPKSGQKQMEFAISVDDVDNMDNNRTENGVQTETAPMTPPSGPVTMNLNINAPLPIEELVSDSEIHDDEDDDEDDDHDDQEDEEQNKINDDDHDDYQEDDEQNKINDDDPNVL